MYLARALDPALRARLAERLVVEELPFVRGRTVVPAGHDLLIAGHPNYLGVFDVSPRPWVAVTGRWSALHQPRASIAQIEIEPPVDRADAESYLAATEELAKQAAQLRGVTVAFPPESPVLVLLLVVDPAMIDLPGATPLDAYPELPGGLRIEGFGGDIDGYASALEQVIAEARIETSNRWTQQPGS